MREGIDFLRKREGMASLVVLAFGITLLSYPLITFLPVMARDVFHGGANTFTLFLCLSGAGSVTGALLVAGSASRVGQARKSFIAMACSVLPSRLSDYRGYSRQARCWCLYAAPC